MMRLNQALLATCSRFLCRGDIQVEVNEIQRIFGAEGWRLWLAKPHLPRDWNPFSLGFPALIVDNQPKSPKKQPP